jgi:hypothetical protein
LEWYDTEAGGKVEAVKYAIFIHFLDKSVNSFFYKDREELQKALEKLSKTLN